MVAGAAPPASMIEGMARIGFDITHVYGLTEVYGPAAVRSSGRAGSDETLSEQTRLNGRQGVRYALQEGMTVMDPEAMREVPADGQTMGEIMFRGNIVMKGYLKNPKATDEAFAGGWFHTGDLAVLEPDRYVKIKDRSKDIIISGGENISSIEVEDALYRHAGGAGLRGGRPAGRKWGETPLAYVELQARRRGRRAQELVAHCKSLLAGYKVPSEIRFEDDPEDLDRQDPEVRAARAGAARRRRSNRSAMTRLTRARPPAACCARRDARGVVTLTLNRPQAFNALSEACSTRCRPSSTRRRGRDGARRRDRRRGQGVLRRPRPEGDARRAVARLLQALFAQCARDDAGDPAPAGAGDRAGAGHRHRGGLPAGGDVRPGGRASDARFAVSGVNVGLFCSTPGVAPVAQRGAQGGVRDARDRRLHRRRGGAREGPGQPRRRARARSTPRSRRWSQRIVAKPRVAVAMGKQLFYRQLEIGIEAAYEDAGAHDGLQHDGRGRARRRAGVHRQAPAGLAETAATAIVARHVATVVSCSSSPTAHTSARATTCRDPAFTTSPRARSVLPTAGASRLILNSEVTTSPTTLAATQAQAVSAM